MVICVIYSILYTVVSFLFALEYIGRWFFPKKEDYPVQSPRVRFAALIAARNEETVIEGCVKSLLAQNYPQELFDVYVLVNNTKDHTAKKAQQAGAEVILCSPEIRNKGDALRSTFEAFLKMDKGYDAFCIFDADNLVESSFLQCMNDCYLAGYPVAQGLRNIRNPYTSTHTFFMTTFFSMINHFYNETHHRLGLSIGLNGTGLMIGADVLRKTGYAPLTMVEDMEYTAICALQNIPIAWVEKAQVLDEQPVRMKDSIRQRRRWNAGQLQVLQHYGLELLKKHTIQSLDALFYLFGAIHISLSFILMLIAGLLSVLLSGLPIWMLLVGCIGGYLLYLCIEIIVCFTRARCFHEKTMARAGLKRLLAIPIIYGLWGFVALSSVLLPPKYHTYITHTGDTDESIQVFSD